MPGDALAISSNLELVGSLYMLLHRLLHGKE